MTSTTDAASWQNYCDECLAVRFPVDWLIERHLLLPTGAFYQFLAPVSRQHKLNHFFVQVFPQASIQFRSVLHYVDPVAFCDAGSTPIINANGLDESVWTDVAAQMHHVSGRPIGHVRNCIGRFDELGVLVQIGVKEASHPFWTMATQVLSSLRVFSLPGEAEKEP